MTCRICLEEGNTVNICNCKGTQGEVHLKCIKEWQQHSKNTKCELCHAEYKRIPEIHWSQLGLGIHVSIIHAILTIMYAPQIIYDNDIDNVIILHLSLIHISEPTRPY